MTRGQVDASACRYHGCCPTRAGSHGTHEGNASSGTGSTADLTTSPDINLGRIQPNPNTPSSGINYFSGGLDEVALYTTVLSPATVQAHFAAR